MLHFIKVAKAMIVVTMRYCTNLAMHKMKADFNQYMKTVALRQPMKSIP
jgi:hypothetical protein